MRRLLPLNALRVFEVAARTNSYVEAATELGLTHGAVSRQIAILEGWLGQRLFTRSGRRMVATPIARAFAAEVSLSFDRLTAAAEACGQPATRRILRISAPTTFASRWLIPRLEKFHESHPLVEVSVTTVTTGHEELRGGFDVAVRRGKATAEAWPQHRATHLFDDLDTLVMSPALFERRQIRKASDIAGHVLLSSETRPGDWADWLEEAGLAHMAGQRRRIFDHFHVTLQAIVDGLGIGIGPLPLLETDVRAGRLITPLPDLKVSRTGYIALVPFDADKTAPMKALVDWLVAEGKRGAAER